MQRLNAQGLDESQFLPEKVLNPKTGIWEKFPIVNAFRARHGRVVYEGEAVRALDWLPHLLHHTLDERAKPLINRDEVHICETIQRIIISTRVALGISDLRNYTLPPGLESDNPEVDRFIALLQQLLPYQSQLCWWVVCDEYNHGNIALAQHLISSIHSSLENAKKIIDDCK